MVLDASVPAPVRDTVAAMWRYRERVEHEAAALFSALAVDLDTAGHPALAHRARVAAEDERRHADRCRAIVDACGVDLPPLTPRVFDLGPVADAAGRAGAPDPGRRALYASVAIACITETLSCALLIAMRDAATFGPTRAAVDEIIKDEIEHSRIGWAHLATCAARADVSWLAAHVAAMRAAALTHDVGELPTADDLAGYGILPRSRVTTIVDATWRDVIVPGLARNGIHLAG